MHMYSIVCVPCQPGVMLHSPHMSACASWQISIVIYYVHILYKLMYTKQQGHTPLLCYPVDSRPSMCRERSLGRLGGRRDRISAQPAGGEEEGGGRGRA